MLEDTELHGVQRVAVVVDVHAHVGADEELVAVGEQRFQMHANAHRAGMGRAGRIGQVVNIQVVAIVLDEKDVIPVVDSEHIYAVPQALNKEHLDDQVVEKLNIWTKAPDLTKWQDVVEKLRHPSNGEVRIAIVGKYVDNTESYKSLSEALTHGGIGNDCRVSLKYIDAEKIERDGVDGHFEDVDGILVPGGFGERGTEGKVMAIEYARKHKIPFFGICLGMQMAVIEFARNVCGIKEACSSEFRQEGGETLIHLMEEQKAVSKKGWHHASGGFPLYHHQRDTCSRRV